MEVFEKPNHKIIHGDVIESLDREIADESIDLIFADPPYNIGKNFNGTREKWDSEAAYLKWCYNWLDLCIAKLTACGSLYVMTSTQNMPHLDLYLRTRLTILSRIVWYYDSSGVQAKRYYGSLYEPILFCVKNPEEYTFNADEILIEARTGAVRKLIDYRKPTPAPYSTKKVPGNVWHIPRVRYRMDEYENHPTQKPTALLQMIIKASSNSGETVLDPFSGTFTTSFVAKQLGRNSVGIEKEETYVKIGLRRLDFTHHYKGEILQKPPKSTRRRSIQQGLVFEAD
jgi:site-specific DNA-methyltransferase (adenine-specific)